MLLTATLLLVYARYLVSKVVKDARPVGQIPSIPKAGEAGKPVTSIGGRAAQAFIEALASPPASFVSEKNCHTPTEAAGIKATARPEKREVAPVHAHNVYRTVQPDDRPTP